MATDKLVATGLQTSAVYVGAKVNCQRCAGLIKKGELAQRTMRRAETYRERCHADRRGMVAWYRHPGCSLIEAGEV
jgi:hypothetical protein